MDLLGGNGVSICFEVKRTIHVSKQTAYTYLLDLESAKQWMRGLVRIERLDDGPLQVGNEVIELDEPEKIVIRCDGTNGPTGKGEFVLFKLESSDNYTEVS